MNTIVVKFLGDEYTFPDDLQEFIRILQYFDSFHNDLNPLLLNLMKESEWKDGTENGLEYFKVPMISIANKVIEKLSRYGIYNVTISDLVDNNPGFINLKEAGNNALDSMKKILSNSMSEWLQGYENAQSEANSKVTGMGFSIWTSSLTSALVYSAMESSTIKKQQNRAQQEYQISMRKLHKSTNDRRKNQENDLLVNYYYPAVADSLNRFVNYMMGVYITKLDEKGILDFSSVEKFNMQRSSEILKNLNIVDDKVALLKEAFSYCPYNRDVFAAIIDLNLEDDDFIDTIKVFLLEKSIIDYYEMIIEPFSYPNEIADVLNENKNHIKNLSELKNISEREIYDSITEQYIKCVKEKYRNLGFNISNKNSKILFQDFTDDEIFECDDNQLKTYSELTVEKIVSASSFEALVNICGYSEMISEISPDNGDTEYKSKNEIDNYYISEIYKMLSQELPKEKELRNQKVEDDITQSINDREERYKKNRNLKIQKTVLVITLLILIALPIVINYIIVSHQEKELKKLIRDIVIENYNKNVTDTYISECEITDEFEVHSLLFFYYENNKKLVIPEIEIHSNNPNANDSSINLALFPLFDIPTYKKEVFRNYILIDSQANYRVIQNNSCKRYREANMQSSLSKLYYDPYFENWKIGVYVVYLIIVAVIFNKFRRKLLY